MRVFLLACVVALPLAGCANKSVSDVSVVDAGQAYPVKFGTVLAQSPVNIRSSGEAASSGGALLGGVGGAALGRSTGAVLAGAIVGGLAGAIAHNAAETNNGVAYTIAFADGTTQVINQLQAETDPVFQPGAPVMVQFGATRNIVSSAANLPNTVAQPKQVRVQGAPVQSGKVGVRSCQATAMGNSVKDSCTTQ